MQIDLLTLIDQAVAEAAPHSDMFPEGLVSLAEVFYDAHRCAPGGLSIEVGTRCGGSALLQLRLLEALYPYDLRPMLWTVDPYGAKPYKGGDGVVEKGLYSDSDYIEAKKLLAPFANHAHFALCSLDFWSRLSWTPYWYMHRERHADDLTFVLLDGDHDAETICAEVAQAYQLLAPGGIILVDNADKDPKTDEALATMPMAWGGRLQPIKGPVGQRIIRKPR